VWFFVLVFGGVVGCWVWVFLFFFFFFFVFFVFLGCAWSMKGASFHARLFLNVH